MTWKGLVLFRPSVKSPPTLIDNDARLETHDLDSGDLDLGQRLPSSAIVFRKEVVQKVDQNGENPVQFTLTLTSLNGYAKLK